MNKKYRPKLDRLYWTLLAVTDLVIGVPLLIISFLEPISLFVLIPTLIFVNYFFISPLFGYVELREGALFIKYGFFLRKSIPYEKIREMKIESRIIAESMLALKNAMEHVVIKYNRFDVTIVSVKDNLNLVNDLNERIKANK